MKNLRDLIERVEGLDGPDRDCDLDIAIATDQVPPEVTTYGPYLRRKERDRVDPYTESIEAAITLCERVLPGWRNSSIKTSEGVYAAYV